MLQHHGNTFHASGPNHSTLWRWLLPDWSGERNPTARDIARAASEMGVPYTLVTGIPLPRRRPDVPQQLALN